MDSAFAIVTKLLHQESPKQDGFWGLAVWTLDQNHEGCPLVTLLERERQQEGLTEAEAFDRFCGAVIASGRYEKQGLDEVSLVREPRWSLAEALVLFRQTMDQLNSPASTE